MKVCQENEYLFANTGGSLYHADGTKMLREACSQAGVPPINATKMRHYTATGWGNQKEISEIASKVFYGHMSHSKYIDENIYMSPFGVREVLTVGPFLKKLHRRSSGNI